MQRGDSFGDDRQGRLVDGVAPEIEACGPRQSRKLGLREPGGEQSVPPPLLGASRAQRTDVEHLRREGECERDVIKLGRMGENHNRRAVVKASEAGKRISWPVDQHLLRRRK